MQHDQGIPFKVNLSSTHVARAGRWSLNPGVVQKRKETPGTADAALPTRPSVAIWVPILWYVLESSQNISRWLIAFGYQVASPSTNYIEGSPIDRAVYSSLMVVGILILLARLDRVVSFIKNNGWLVALFLFMLVSIAWSDFAAVSFKRWTRALGDVVMALVILTDRDALVAGGAVLRRALYFNIPVSIILIKYFREIGTGWDNYGNEMWIGGTPQKNVLGQVVMIGALYFLFEIMRRLRDKKFDIQTGIYALYALMALWLLKGPPDSRSNTSIALFGVGLMVLIGLSLMKSHRDKIGKYLVLGGIAAGLVFIVVQGFQTTTGISIFEASVEATGRDTTLTGRTELWDDVLRIAADHPILGVGYGSFWIGNTHNLWDKHIWGPTQGHNGYVDVYVELGIVGVLLLAGVIISAYRGILQTLKWNFDLGVLLFVYLTVIVLHNVTESSYLRGSVDLWFVFLLTAIRLPPPDGAPSTFRSRTMPRGLPQRTTTV